MAGLARSRPRGMFPGCPAEPWSLATRSAFPGGRGAGREQSVSGPPRKASSSSERRPGGGRPRRRGPAEGGWRGLSRPRLPCWSVWSKDWQHHPRSRRKVLPLCGEPVSRRVRELRCPVRSHVACTVCFSTVRKLKFTKHRVPPQQGRLGQPTQRQQLLLPQSQHVNRQEDLGPTTSSTGHHHAPPPGSPFTLAPWSQTRRLPSPCRGLSLHAEGHRDHRPPGSRAEYSERHLARSSKPR